MTRDIFIKILFICFFTPMIAQVPSDLMENCRQWKITYPTGTEDKTLCNEPNNEYFYVNTTGDAIVFRTPIRSDSGTTPNSKNIRSELRERKEDGSLDIYWTTEGTHTLYVKQAITHLPIKKPALVATQIHGDKEAGIDDAMVLRLESSHLFLSFNGGKLRENITISNNYTLGTVHEVIFKVVDGKHYCYYSEEGNLLHAYQNNTASQYLIKVDGNDYVMDLDYDQSYFKVGNYTQSNPTEEDDFTGLTNNYGEVLVYDFFATHGKQNVTGIALTPSVLELSKESSYLLEPTIIPSTATNKKVRYSSSNSAVATISPQGLIVAKTPGETTLTVTTEDGGFAANCFVTVLDNALGPNLALNKTIIGTGTPDGENKVDNLVDGVTDTRWSVSGYPQTATIDLGEVYDLGRTELTCYSDRAYQYTIAVSDREDGAYTTIVNRSNNETPGTENNPIINTFSEGRGRFIKITVTGAAFYSGTWVSLTELKVFEDLSLGINPHNKNEETFALWPNPVKNILHFTNYTECNQLQIYDHLGRIVLSKSKTIDGNIEVSGLTNGVYLLKLSYPQKTITKRFLKKE